VDVEAVYTVEASSHLSGILRFAQSFGAKGVEHEPGVWLMFCLSSLAYDFYASD
jgi:hypothetical protein